jgi:alkylation response protein AidB-like acyl-CoA dehydrogenase
VFARTGSGKSDISVFLVEGSQPGISHVEIPKLGNLAAPTFTVTFDGVRVPETALLGAVHGAWEHVKASLDLERVAVATECIGAARACLHEAIAYARQRQQFGRPIIEFQALRHKLVDMYLELEAAKRVTYHAADLIAEGRDAKVEAAAAKYLTGLAYHRCAIDGLSVLGGYGYSTAYPLERHLRDASLYRIVPGAEVLKDSIARRVLR